MKKQSTWNKMVHAPFKKVVADCECQGFEDQGSTWNDTFVTKSRQQEF